MLSVQDNHGFCAAIAGQSDLAKTFIKDSLLPEGILVSSFDSVYTMSKELSMLSCDICLAFLENEAELKNIGSYIYANPFENIPFILLLHDNIKNSNNLPETAICLPVSIDLSDLKMWTVSLMNFKRKIELAKERDSRNIADENSYKIRQVYRDVISAVTQNKLKLLLSASELPFYPPQTKVLEIKINNSDGLVSAKEQIEKYFVSKGWSKTRIFDIIVSVSEAVSNVLKHAQNGIVSIFGIGDKFHIWVSDNGKGIDFSDIPKSALQKGHSTRNSLGMGFCIMLELADQLLLFTHSMGTIIIMELSKEKPQSALKSKKTFNIEERQLN